jgi:hypothetical protein
VSLVGFGALVGEEPGVVVMRSSGVRAGRLS